jgi:hypothetical protein
MLNSLLKKIISTSAGRTRFIMAFIGLSVAMLLILLAVQLQSNYNYLLYSKTNEDSTANFLVINKEVNNNTIGNTRLSSELLTDLKKQPFIDSVGYISAGKFKASVESMIEAFPFYTDIAFESVEDAFLDVHNKDWQWTEQSSFIPMIIPNMFLDIYNFQFSLSQGYPQITPDMLKMMSFKVNLYTPAGEKRSYIGRIVGFSDRVSSVMVPYSFMQWANTNFSTGKSNNPGRVIIKTKDPGNPQLVNYLKQNGLTTDADKTRFSKYRKIVNVVVNVSWFTGIVMLLFALLVFTLFIQLTIASCKNEIQLLVTLGASPTQLRKFLMKQFFPPNIIIIVLSVVVISILQYALYILLQKQNIFLQPIISYYTMAVGLLVLVILWWVNYSTIRRYIEG